MGFREGGGLPAAEPPTASHSPTGASRASIRKSGESKEQEFNGLAAPLTHTSPKLCSPCAGRYSQISSYRGSVARSVGGGAAPRGSVLRGRGTALDSSGLPCERIVVIDPEDGRDRTPKPLVAARPHGAPPPDAWASSEAAGGTASGGRDSVGRASVLSFGPALPGIPSARSFLASETGDGSAERGASQDGWLPAAGARAGRQSVLHHAAASAAASAAAGGTGAPPAAAAGEEAQRSTLSGGRFTPLAADLLGFGGRAALLAEQPEQQGPQDRRKHCRSQAVQCGAAAPRTTRGVQVLPWELRGAAAANDAAGEGIDGAADGNPGQAAGQAEAAVAAAGEGVEDEEALAAMQQQQSVADLRGPGFQSHSSSPLGSHRGLLSQSSSRRGSVAGSVAGRMSSLHGGEHYSRRSTMSTAADQWGGADRDSLGSGRTSFAAFAAEGRGSVMSTAGGFYPLHPSSGGRASVVSLGQHRRASPVPQPAAAAAPPALTPAEALAREQRRQRAEQERVLAAMPGLLQKLQAAERAVLLGSQHAKLAQAHGVLLCRAAPEEWDGTRGSPGDQPAAAGGAAGEEQGQQEEAGHASTDGHTAAQPAGPEGSSARLPAAASGSATPLGSGRQQAQLALLWQWRTDLAGELPASCLAFNRAAPGLLAVGYGRQEFGVEGAGLVAVWSLANPAHPVWHAATPCGVSALDWSSKAPSCLAVGFFDGGLALYDARGAGGSKARPLAAAPPAGPSGTSGGHAEPVWRLRHVPKASDPGEEMLVSIGTDGRVLEWKHAQGLERSELLRLRRAQPGGGASGVGGLPGKAGGAAQGAASAAEGYLGRAAGGTCFDFHPADPRTFLVGTEEGLVHCCSTSLSEQGRQPYRGHLAPVYQVCWSPFSPSHFLTASADWSVRLWDEAQPRRALATLQLPGATAEVADAAFCPAAATLLAAAAGNTLQLWDVEASVLAPRAQATQLGMRLTALAFSPAAPIVVAAADDGGVSVYSLAGFYDAAAAAEAAEGVEGSAEHWRQEQRRRLEAALRLHTSQQLSD